MHANITFRPHHFLCSLAYQGLGYSAAFVKNYDKIIKIIRADDETPIQVIMGLDNICKSCPHSQIKTNRCVSQEKISKLDKAHREILALHPGEILTWREAKKRIKNNFSLEDFHKACEPCEWKNMGMCEDALIKLKNIKD
jgi:hypothetical protein